MRALSIPALALPRARSSHNICQFSRNRGAATSHSDVSRICAARASAFASTLDTSLGSLPYPFVEPQADPMRHLELGSVRNVRVDRPAVPYVDRSGVMVFNPRRSCLTSC